MTRSGVLRHPPSRDAARGEGHQREGKLPWTSPSLESLGYETLYSSEGYSNHVHPLPGLGRVDCIYVGEPTATTLFEGAAAMAIFGETIRVPRPKHLAAMKVLAMKNDPTRTFQEMADLQHILGLPGVDMDEIRGHFERYGLLEKFHELRRILDADRS